MTKTTLVNYTCTCGKTMRFKSINGIVAPVSEWRDLSLDDLKIVCMDTWSYDPYVIAQAVQNKLKELNT